MVLFVSNPVFLSTWGEILSKSGIILADLNAKTLETMVDTPSTYRRKRNLRDILLENCVTSENGYFACTIDAANGCKYRQRREKYDPGNFIRHIRSVHPILAKSRGLLQEEAEVPAKKTKIAKVPVEIDRQKLLEGMIKLICVHNVPMLCVEWEGFRVILQPILDALKIQLNRQNLVCHLGVAAEKVRSEISTDVKGKLLCLKIDSATRLGRHMLGVNIQFYDSIKKDIVIYTIGNMSL